MPARGKKRKVLTRASDFILYAEQLVTANVPHVSTKKFE